MERNGGRVTPLGVESSKMSEGESPLGAHFARDKTHKNLETLKEIL